MISEIEANPCFKKIKRASRLILFTCSICLYNERVLPHERHVSTVRDEMDAAKVEIISASSHGEGRTSPLAQGLSAAYARYLRGSVTQAI